MPPAKLWGHLYSYRPQKHVLNMTFCFIYTFPRLRASCFGGSLRPWAARTGRSPATRYDTGKDPAGANLKPLKAPSFTSSWMVMNKKLWLMTFWINPSSSLRPVEVLMNVLHLLPCVQEEFSYKLYLQLHSVGVQVWEESHHSSHHTHS